MIVIRHEQQFNQFVKQYPAVMDGVYGSMRPRDAYRKISQNAGFRYYLGCEDIIKTLNELARHIEQNYTRSV